MSYAILGTDDSCSTCEACGKKNLKKVVVLGVLDADGNQTAEVRYGVDCAALAYKGKKTKKYADRVWALAQQETARSEGRRFGEALGQAMLVDVCPLKASEGKLAIHSTFEHFLHTTGEPYLAAGVSATFGPFTVHRGAIPAAWSEHRMLEELRGLLCGEVITACTEIAFPSGLVDDLNAARRYSAALAAYDVLATWRPT